MDLAIMIEGQNGLTWPRWQRLARAVEDLGFAGLYRSDHFNLAKKGVPMLYTKAGVDSPGKGADWGKRWLEDYTAKRYHQPSDEYDASWDVSGIVKDLQLYYDVGRAIADSARWPNWYPGTEFRAIRDASRR